MPLSDIQIEILRLLASQRDPESYVAGSTPLNQNAPRYSGDIDIFHDREERVALTAAEDAAVLEAHGYNLQWQRREPAIFTVVVERASEATKLEWVADSDYRFFPTMRDELFGYVLHPVDLAMNKVMAAAGRREVRDLVDLVTIHQSVLPLGAVIWAAVDKSPGFTPEGLIGEIRRNSKYSLSEWRSLVSREPLDPDATMIRIREILTDAEAFVNRMPTARAGVLFLKDGHVVQPDTDHVDEYQTHAGQRRGQWPSSPEIARAMLERYTSPPSA
jgi:hypothetical protein